jgi:hypothetical protein
MDGGTVVLDAWALEAAGIRRSVFGIVDSFLPKGSSVHGIGSKSRVAGK